MNSFFKNFWAALLAFVVGSLLTGLVSLLIVTSILASVGSSSAVMVKPSSVLHIDMGTNMVDAPSNKSGTLDLNMMTVTSSSTLLETLRALELAADDRNIKGIYLNFTGFGSMGIAQAEELRAAIKRFRETSGKFVIAYNENYSQLGYYLGSVADKVIMNPEGMFDWRGVSATVMFYKGLLDKLDVEMEIYRHGTFKSAVEPYSTDRMSAANRLQMETYVNSLWNVLLEDISASRNIDVATLKGYADRLEVRSAADAKRLGLVDEVLYEDQVNNMLAALAADEQVEDPAEVSERTRANMISMGDYISGTAVSTRRVSKNKIAIVYAEGSIQSGQNSRDVVGSATVAEQLARARKDDGVKAVVFRINSPGGSALASETMWREVELLRREKPVIVSMGGVAASGGYYIACNADAIIADRSTLTGSIGVYIMLPNLQNTFRNKLGITIDAAKSGPSADMLTGFRPSNNTEKEFLQNNVESVYSTFVNHVADGRNMTFGQVDSIGQGRVWLATDALGIGLIDGFGGITDAVALAAERAGVADDYRIFEVTDPKTSLSALLQVALSGSAEAKLRSELGEAFIHYNHLMETMKEPGVQARMPYVIEIN